MFEWMTSRSGLSVLHAEICRCKITPDKRDAIVPNVLTSCDDKKNWVWGLFDFVDSTRDNGAMLHITQVLLTAFYSTVVFRNRGRGRGLNIIVIYDLPPFPKKGPLLTGLA